MSGWAAAKEDAPAQLEPSPALDGPPEFLCPITLDMMWDPVVGPTGITYDRAGIEAWLLPTGRGTCPVTHGELCAEDLVPNHTLRRHIQAWCAANSFHGVERVPTPRTPATPAQAADAVAEVEAAAREGDAAWCAEAARGVRHLARVADRNRQCLASAGAARALAVAFASFAPSAGAAGTGDVLDDVLAALVLVMPIDEEAIAAIGSSRASVARLVTVAAHGDLHRRLQAVVLVREIITFLCNGSGAGAIDLSANVDAIVEVVVKTVRDAICPQATKACLVAACHLAQADECAAARLAAAGLVPVLVELLVDADRSSAEMALATLDATLASSDGRARARADALAVPVLVKKMFRVSDTATELVVSALWRICKLRQDDDGMDTAEARRLAIVEALHVGALQKLLLLLQVGCMEETKEKATELLGLMVKYQAKGECIDTMDFKGLNKVS
ncbi:U-box domain-containing protein 21-like [Phragmites australis]|uniref:U-box domain-containing protein 21-like n=1 Tax=Phragmites australis TaxID=29695 RepID=UPI002D7A376F|nr:U-box domain-containing protein 21-like [Phragmites australis]